MSWISKEHKTIYFKAFSALYKDIKTASGSLIDTTGNLLSAGYEKVRDGAEYIDKKLHEDDDSFEGVNNPIYESRDDSDYEIDNSDDTDDCLVQMGKIYPDVLINLNSKHNNLNRIWIIDGAGNHKRIKGKIASYEYVNTIIHNWFRYEKSVDSDRYKWYPTEDLYTAYRDSTPRKLNPINKIIFRYDKSGYQPYPYHPLF